MSPFARTDRRCFLRPGPFPSLAGAFSLLLALFALGAATAHAWGPHGEIVQAALATLGPRDPLKASLGTNANLLVKYVWMADWRGQLQLGRTETFYTDDYLLFPTVTNHSSHICPEVRRTYAPHFHRALQALRTESPREAARWIGSLLHFVTDTGSPPHALGILGPVHSKMENWLDAKLILLPGYQPRLLGTNDSSGEAGLLQRMDGLIEYSKERALRCRADVMADRRPPVEPVVLESALETARVVADLLHTLGTLAPSRAQGSSLTGVVIRPQLQSPELAKVPAKIVLLGTRFSTLTDPAGAFEFHHLPAGRYEAVASVPGRVTAATPVNLPPNGTVRLETINLSEAGGGNLLRNPHFHLRWVAPNQADGWTQTWRPGRPVSATGPKDWDGEWIPLQNGVTYQLAAQWKANPSEDPHRSVGLRTKGRTNDSPTVTHPAAVTPTNRLVTITGSEELAWVTVSVRGLQPPWELLESVTLKPVASPAEKPKSSAAAPPKPPNIVLILADDLGWMDLHCQGNPLLDTPHLDRLAKQGMRFTDAYAATPVCTPTRAAMMTGKSPARLGITNHAPGHRPGFVPKGRDLAEAENLTYLPLGEITIAERLKKAGYATGFIGKWHLSDRRGADEKGPWELQLRPEHQGFDLNIGGCDRGGPPSFFEPYGIPNIPPRRKGDYLPERLADECISFLRTNQAKPFFLCWWDYSVHYPIQAPEHLIQKYRQRAGIKDPAYAAMIEGMDGAIGRVLQELDSLGLATNTLVLFTSDNGSLFGNEPLRANKGFLYEGGIRVPWIVRWPGWVKPGSTCSVPVISTDTYPTLLEAAGLKPLPAESPDGESLLPLLRQTGSLQRKALYFHYPNYAFHQRNRLGGAVREGDFKLIRNYDDDSLELYNLAADLGETRNLSASHPALAQQLKAKLESWLKSSGARMPVPVSSKP